MKLKFFLSIRFFCLLLIISVSNVTLAQGPICMPVEVCAITNLSQGGESKTCWTRTECTSSSTGFAYSPGNPFPNSIPTPQGGSGGQVYRGPGVPPELQKMCANMQIEYSACKLDAQNRYAQQISGCKNHIIFGSAGGTAGLGAAAVGSGGWALVALGVGAIGASSAGYGASACYNDKAAARDTRLAWCDKNLAKMQKACAQ